MFDTSSKVAGCALPNEALHVRPELNPDILQLLLQFPACRASLMADIEKTFFAGSTG